MPSKTRDTEEVAIGTLRPHPQNYRTHPAEQIEHIKRSIEEHGIYRNIITAKDGTILAGHGVYRAVKELGYPTIPIIRLPIDRDDPQAKKLLVGDNEIAGLAIDNDEMLADLLQQVRDDAEYGLIGTGFSDDKLGSLLSSLTPEFFDEDEDRRNIAGAGARDVEPPDDFASYDDDIETQYCCPSCGYEWSGKPR